MGGLFERCDAHLDVFNFDRLVRVIQNALTSSNSNGSRNGLVEHELQDCRDGRTARLLEARVRLRDCGAPRLPICSVELRLLLPSVKGSSGCTSRTSRFVDIPLLSEL